MKVFAMEYCGSHYAKGKEGKDGRFFEYRRLDPRDHDEREGD